MWTLQTGLEKGYFKKSKIRNSWFCSRESLQLHFKKVFQIIKSITGLANKEKGSLNYGNHKDTLKQTKIMHLGPTLIALSHREIKLRQRHRKPHSGPQCSPKSCKMPRERRSVLKLSSPLEWPTQLVKNSPPAVFAGGLSLLGQEAESVWTGPAFGCSVWCTGTREAGRGGRQQQLSPSSTPFSGGRLILHSLRHGMGRAPPHRQGHGICIPVGTRSKHPGSWGRHLQGKSRNWPLNT